MVYSLRFKLTTLDSEKMVSLQVAAGSTAILSLLLPLLLAVPAVRGDNENICSDSLGPQVHLPREWHLWKQKHGKTYSSFKTELERHVIWQANQQYIDAHNRYNSTFGYTLAMNRLGDLSEVEYQKQYGCIDHSDNGSSPLVYYSPLSEDASNLPTSVDWHTKSAVAPVKDQGDCCASYAFSAVGTLEGMEALANGHLTMFSEQNIIDCSVPYGNHGCTKGAVDRAFEYIIEQGINTNDVYPFRGSRKRCRYRSNKPGVTLRSYQWIRRGKEVDLQNAVAMEGPISAAVDASHNTFRFYGSGVYDQPTCSSTKVNHAVVVVGYGKDEHGKDYWSVKNSWGVMWGEDGYIRMSRNQNNQCGIASRAIFPAL